MFLRNVLATAALLVAPALYAQAPSAAAASTPPKTVGCKADRQPLTPAEIAYHRSKYKEAADLFVSELQSHPTDDRLRAGQIRTRLGLAQISEAVALADAWVAEKPSSGAALTAKAETTLRKGELPEAYSETARAQKLDPCNGRVYYVLAEYEDMTAMYAMEKRHLDLAHALSPTDPEVTFSWIDQRPKLQAKKDWADFVESNPVFTEAEREAARKRIARTTEQKQDNDCRLASALRETTVPFSAIRYAPDAAPIYGLEMTFNGKKRRLQLDTGASGLTLTTGAAERLGLATEETAWMGGIGDDGARKARVTHVAQLKIGNLEFANCNVYILPPRNMDYAGAGLTPFMDEIDGLIGGDLFRSFLLTLDYPGGEMKVSPLPARPGDPPELVTLETSRDRHNREPGTGAPQQDRYRSPEMKDWATFYRIYHYLLIPTQLNDGPVKLLMADTGADQNLISPNAARMVTRVDRTNKVMMQGISGAIKDNYLTDKIVLHFAQLYLPLPWMIAVDTTNVSKGAGVEISGFLGFPALRQMTLQIDYRDNLIHFAFDPKRAPNPKFASTPFNQ